MDISSGAAPDASTRRNKDLRRGLLFLTVVLIASFAGHWMSESGHYSAFALIPTLVVITMALLTRRTMESLLAGCLSGFLILSPQTAIQGFAASGMEVMQNPTMGWIVLVCGLLGSLIGLLQFVRSTDAFSTTAGRFLKTPCAAKLGASGLGLLIFIDDYLNAMTVSAAMKKLFDRLGVSRSMLAYIVDSTAAPVCLLIPFSTWAIYISGLLEGQNLAPSGEGFTYYLTLIPSLYYPWAALIVVLLVSLNVIPALGKMKQAEAGQEEVLDREVASHESDESGVPPRLMNFIVPIVSLLLATWWFDIDALMGVGCALLVTLVFYSVQRIASLNNMFDELMNGFQQMLLPLGIVFSAFILQDVNEKLGLAQTLIDWVQPVMHGSVLPAVAFLLLSALAFATGSFWGIYAIAFPIVIPLAQATDASMALTLGATISAGAFGSHACFFGDSTVLSARGCGVTPYQHAITQLPYVLMAALASVVLYLIAG